MKCAISTIDKVKFLHFNSGKLIVSDVFPFGIDFQAL